MPKTLATMSRAELIRAEIAADDAHRQACDEMINAGRGRETMNEIRAAAEDGFDPMARAYVRIMDTCAAINAEKRERMAYQGNLNPIRRVA